MKYPKTAQWLRSALERRGMQQAELARRLSERIGRSLDRAAINKIAKGTRKLALDEMFAIAELTGAAPLNPADCGISSDDHISSEDVAAALNHASEGPGDGRPKDGILEIDVRGGLGGGGAPDGEVRVDGNYADPVKSEAWHFPARFMREEVRAPEDRIIIMETIGDSMTPTILSGDRVIVDTGHRLPSPDGIYAIRDRYGMIVVKRLHLMRRGDPPRVKIISDNTHHPEEEVGADEIEIVGRVLWGLKRL